MAQRISDLYLFGEFESYSIPGQTGDKCLSNMSQVNLFVAPNNSGKSRFLRQVAKMEGRKFSCRDENQAIEAARLNFQQGLTDILRRHNLASVGTFLQDVANLNELDRWAAGEQPAKDLVALLEKAKNPNQHGEIRSHGIFPATHVVSEQIRDLAVTVSESISNIVSQRIQFKVIYLPTLRGLRTWPDGQPLLGNRIKSDYFAKSSLEVFTGETLYNDFQKLLLGTLAEREVMSSFERFLSEAFFEGSTVTIIPRIGDPNIHIRIGSEDEQPIIQLGDGIIALIILTFPLFRHALTGEPKHLLYFVEEPELFMHPGLQRLFLDVITRREGFENFQYFFTTHSNHLLDLTADVSQISIYTFAKKFSHPAGKIEVPTFEITNASSDDRRTLELLGVNNSSVFLSNCTVWVEGITDRRYLSHFLNLYQDSRSEEREEGSVNKRFKEDLHYSFVEYSGGNITHWSFLDNTPDPINVERLCGKLFLITDRDGEASRAKVERQETLRTALGERYYCLQCREIENLIPAKVLREIVAEYEGSIDHVMETTDADYKDIPLGTFIEATLLGGQKLRDGRYAEESGTITSKVEFCKRAIVRLKTYQDLSSEAKAVTEKIFDHITRFNS
jgi:hypothetical protein